MYVKVKYNDHDENPTSAIESRYVGAENQPPVS